MSHVRPPADDATVELPILPPMVPVLPPPPPPDAAMEDDDEADRPPQHRASRVPTLLSSSAVMAAGTVVSRGTGFVRSFLLAAALGLGLHADLFNVANTIPNALYILLAGGLFNAVLVPQLVRAMKHDVDGGEAYTNRIITLAGVFLVVVTVALVAAAPLVMDIYLSGKYDQAKLAAARESAVHLARWCLPQVFFYGMFVLVGQVLNARRRFGPMMWAPIANNVISVAMLVIYLVLYGPASGSERHAAYSSTQEILLGLGSTVGIAVQFLILVPYLKAAGFRYRPRFDFRGTGLGHTLRLGVWTLLFVVVNQIAYTVVVHLGTSGAAGGGTGYSVYLLAFTVVTVPHAVITVSLATAALPTLSARAADGDLAGVARSLSATTRTALAVMVPFAALMPLVASDLARVLLHGAAQSKAHAIAPVLALFAPGVLLFTFHYLMLRGFYALEQTRAVFFNQVWVAATNIVVALVLVHYTSERHTALALVGAYISSYFVGGLLSYLTLRSRLGGLDTARLLRFLVRLVVAVALATGAAWIVSAALGTVSASPQWPTALLFGALVTTVDVAAFLLLATLMRIDEVTSVLHTLTRRLSRAR